MSRRNITIIALVVLLIGVAAVFISRPSPAPMEKAETATAAPPSVQVSNDARGVQYFAANLEEARRITVGCRDGSVRDDECANAERAIVEAESRDRFKRFRDR